MGRYRRQWRGVSSVSWRGAVLLVAGVLAGIGLVVGVAMADGDPTPSETPGRADESALPGAPVSAPPVRVTDGASDKLDAALAQVASTARTAGDESALAVAQANGLAVAGGSIRVLVESATPDLTGARAAIVATGGVIEGEYAETIQALLPPSGLDLVAASPDVRLIRAPAARTPDRAR